MTLTGFLSKFQKISHRLLFDVGTIFNILAIKEAISYFKEHVHLSQSIRPQQIQLVKLFGYRVCLRICRLNFLVLQSFTVTIKQPLIQQLLTQSRSQNWICYLSCQDKAHRTGLLLYFVREKIQSGLILPVNIIASQDQLADLLNQQGMHWAGIVQHWILLAKLGVNNPCLPPICSGSIGNKTSQPYQMVLLARAQGVYIEDGNIDACVTTLQYQQQQLAPVVVHANYTSSSTCSTYRTKLITALAKVGLTDHSDSLC